MSMVSCTGHYFSSISAPPVHHTPPTLELLVCSVQCEVFQGVVCILWKRRTSILGFNSSMFVLQLRNIVYDTPQGQVGFGGNERNPSLLVRDDQRMTLYGEDSIHHSIPRLFQIMSHYYVVEVTQNLQKLFLIENPKIGPTLYTVSGMAGLASFSKFYSEAIFQSNGSNK